MAANADTVTQTEWNKRITEQLMQLLNNEIHALWYLPDPNFPEALRDPANAWFTSQAFGQLPLHIHHVIQATFHTLRKQGYFTLKLMPFFQAAAFLETGLGTSWGITSYCFLRWIEKIDPETTDAIPYIFRIYDRTKPGSQDYAFLSILPKDQNTENRVAVEKHAICLDGYRNYVDGLHGSINPYKKFMTSYIQLMDFNIRDFKKDLTQNLEMARKIFIKEFQHQFHKKFMPLANNTIKKDDRYCVLDTAQSYGYVVDYDASIKMLIHLYGEMQRLKEKRIKTIGLPKYQAIIYALCRLWKNLMQKGATAEVLSVIQATTDKTSYISEKAPNLILKKEDGKGYSPEQMRILKAALKNIGLDNLHDVRFILMQIFTWHCQEEPKDIVEFCFPSCVHIYNTTPLVVTDPQELTFIKNEILSTLNVLMDRLKSLQPDTAESTIKEKIPAEFLKLCEELKAADNKKEEEDKEQIQEFLIDLKFEPLPKDTKNDLALFYWKYKSSPEFRQQINDAVNGWKALPKS